MNIYRGLKEASIWAQNIDIANPPATEEYLSALDNSEKVADKIALILIAIVAFSFITNATWICLSTVFLGCAHFIYISRILCIHKTLELMRKIDDEETRELWIAIKNSNSSHVKAYAEGVRRMGRPYRLAEFIAIKNYEEDCAAKESLGSAKSFLYGEQRLDD